MGNIKSCLICGKEFYTFPSYPEKKYCSNKCKGIAYQGRKMLMPPKWRQHLIESHIGLKYPSRIKPPIFHICEYCGKEFEQTRKGKLGRAYKARFCSQQCWYEFIRIKPENHPTFKGGYEPYYGPNWNKQRKEALRRDGYRCRSCSKKTRAVRLDVHHIKPFRSFNGDWKSANELSNLITLCLFCHNSHSSSYPLPLV